jgi:hypothetical protein
MGTQSEIPNRSPFVAWLGQRKKSWAILGAVIVVTTYISKEIVQSGLQEKMQSVERWAMEARLDERLDRLQPNLRDELSSGSDSKKRYVGQGATLFLKNGEYPPGEGKPSVPFATLVDVECAQDDLCRIAEWYRYRGTLAREMADNARLLEVVGKPGFFDLERISFARIDEKLVKAKKREAVALPGITKIGADGNLTTPMRNEVEEFTSAVNAMEGVIDEQRAELKIYVPNVIRRLRRNLRIVTILSGGLFLAGWILSFLGLKYDLGPVERTSELSKIQT